MVYRLVSVRVSQCENQCKALSLSIHIYTHTHIHIYIYTHTCTSLAVSLPRVAGFSSADRAGPREEDRGGCVYVCMCVWVRGWSDGKRVRRGLEQG